jgi:hypothetical protein
LTKIKNSLAFSRKSKSSATSFSVLESVPSLKSSETLAVLFYEVNYTDKFHLIGLELENRHYAVGHDPVIVYS